MGFTALPPAPLSSAPPNGGHTGHRPRCPQALALARSAANVRIAGRLIIFSLDDEVADGGSAANWVQQPIGDAIKQAESLLVCVVGWY